MATRQQRKKRIRAQVDELMKDFSPYATQVGTGNPPPPCLLYTSPSPRDRG